MALLGARLNAHRHVTTVASAGSGKTVQWQLFAAEAGGPLAWVTFDRADASPARLVMSLAVSLERLVPLAPDTVRAALRDELSSVEAAAVLAQAATGSEALLILDAAETVLSADAAVEVIATFLDYLPVGWRVSILTREPLPTLLRRRRLDDALGSVNEEDLRLTEAEVETWAADAGATGGAAEIYAATGGWFTGVALGLRAGIGALEASGDLSEWLVAEILDPLPADTQAFLLETAVAQQVSEDLAVALCGPDGRRLWRDVRRRNLPATTATESALQYHALLQTVLLDQLALRWPGRVDGLRRRYAEHLGRAGHHEEAVEVLLSIGDVDRAAVIAERALVDLYARADWTTLRRWLGDLGDDIVAGRPSLLAARIRALLGVGDFQGARQLVRQLDRRGELRAVTEADPGALAIAAMTLLPSPGEARRLLAHYEGDHRADAVRYLIEVTTGSDTAEPPLSGGWEEVERPITWGLILQGRFDDVVAQLPEDPHRPVTDLNPLLVFAIKGEIEAGTAAWERVPHEIRDRPHALFTEACLLLGGGDVESSFAAWQAAAAEARRTQFWLAPLYEMASAAPLLRLGRTDEAVGLLERSIEFFADSEQVAYLEWTQSFLGMGYLAQGKVAQARNILSECERSMRRAGRRLFLPMAALGLSEAEFRAGRDDRAATLAALAYDTSVAMGSFYALDMVLALCPQIRDREIARRPDDRRWSRPMATPRHVTRGRGRDGPGKASVLDIRVFGADREVILDGARVEVGRVKVMELLGYLARHPDGVDRMVLQEELLPEADIRRGANHFRQITHKLRETTGLSLVRRGSRLTWPDHLQVDATDLAFERLVTSARGVSGAERAARLTEALGLVTGPFLAYSSLPWVDRRRYQLDVMWEEAVLELGELAIAEGTPAAARSSVEQLLEVNPYSEPAYRLLLRIEAEAGTESSRLAVYRRAVDALHELGFEPDEDLRELARHPAPPKGTPGE
jgi:LuxR family transcriptional regulator, maltose regulon positive regulatory protein